MVKSISREGELNLEAKFQLLESKILQAVEKIKELRDENSQLKDNLDLMQSEVKKYEDELRISKEQASEVDQWREKAQNLNQIKLTVTQRVEGLLEQIEALNLQDQ